MMSSQNRSWNPPDVLWFFVHVCCTSREYKNTILRPYWSKETLSNQGNLLVLQMFATQWNHLCPVQKSWKLNHRNIHFWRYCSQADWSWPVACLGKLTGMYWRCVYPEVWNLLGAEILEESQQTWNQMKHLLQSANFLNMVWLHKEVLSVKNIFALVFESHEWNCTEALIAQLVNLSVCCCPEQHYIFASDITQTFSGTDKVQQKYLSKYETSFVVIPICSRNTQYHFKLQWCSLWIEICRCAGHGGTGKDHWWVWILRLFAWAEHHKTLWGSAPWFRHKTTRLQLQPPTGLETKKVSKRDLVNKIKKKKKTVRSHSICMDPNRTYNFLQEANEH